MKPYLLTHAPSYSYLYRLLLALLCVGLTGCATLLPNSQTVTTSFETFEDARQAITALEPMKTDLAALTAKGITPEKQQNTVILTYADIMRRFVLGSVIRREDLDPGIVLCLEAREGCRGWDISASRIYRARTGGFLADFMNYSRRTDITGWRFNAQILLANDVVVYRAWGGQPVINEVEESRNPLGPLQEVGPSLLRNSLNL